MSTAAVIAAAGLSSRMRDFKPLLCLGSSTVIGHTIDALRTAGAAPIVVVTGYQSAVLERHLRYSGVMFQKNERFAQTDMLASLQLGLAALPPEADQVFVTPADVPLVSPDTLKRMLTQPGDVIRPLCHGRGGHPLLLRRPAIGRAMTWRGPGGLKGLLQQGVLDVAGVETGDPAVLMDADTPEDYRRLLHYQTRLRGHGELRLDLQLNIGITELFLTTESVQLLDMIGQTGSLQAACACMHISYSKGWKIINTMERELGFPVALRRPGGADGGGSSLTIRGAELLACYRRFHETVSQQARALFDQVFPEYLRSPTGAKEER